MSLLSALPTFRALRHRDFGLLWCGLAVSAVGTWMQIVAQSLLVLKITHGSAFALGTVSLAQAVAFLFFALVGGRLADHIDKRKLLLVTQSLSAFFAIALGVLTMTGVVRFWMIVVIATLNAVVLSFDQPVRAAIVPLLVPRAELMNAVSLQAMVFSGAAVFGPALAGVALLYFGYAGSFFLNGASYSGVVWAAYLMRLPEAERQSGAMLSTIRTITGTLRHDPVLPWVLSGYAGLLFLGPSASLILPIYSIRILHVGPERLGLLFAAAGAGAIIGSLTVASSGWKRGYFYICGLFLWTAALTVFALSRGFWLSAAALAVYGLGQTFAATTTITMLQTRVPQAMRGRMMSLITLLNMGIRPLGDFPAGALITRIGAPITVLISAALFGSYALFLLTKLKTLSEG